MADESKKRSRLSGNESSWTVLTTGGGQLGLETRLGIGWHESAKSWRLVADEGILSCFDKIRFEGEKESSDDGGQGQVRNWELEGTAEGNTLVEDDWETAPRAWSGQRSGGGLKI